VVTGSVDDENDWSLFYIYICSYLMLMLFGDSDNDGDEGMVHWLN
jgi:hypothetical protein